MRTPPSTATCSRTWSSGRARCSWRTACTGPSAPLCSSAWCFTRGSWSWTDLDDCPAGTAEAATSDPLADAHHDGGTDRDRGRRRLVGVEVTDREHRGPELRPAETSEQPTGAEPG